MLFRNRALPDRLTTSNDVPTTILLLIGIIAIVKRGTESKASDVAYMTALKVKAMTSENDKL